ncbi:hypothetical protein [Actinosynnema pretiosum]|uniref:Uncharacterized protein n=1 Tax=Actinosynnema pretiosum TaxID=42197 RepID=A0A290YZN5_9PSEU|nr:hypothetical protein [Actinosynnema pretiosum]ATE52198.1 hypothetical protein CNX65_01895 [Actinosynnema pretiosum]
MSRTLIVMSAADARERTDGYRRPAGHRAEEPAAPHARRAPRAGRAPFTRRDGTLVTGRNPASGAPAVDLVPAALAERS